VELSIPVVETERLRLRGHALDDFDECALMWGDPIVTRHIGGKPFSAQNVWSKILRYAGHWVLLDFGYWVVEERATNRFVGEVGFADFKRDIDPPFDGTPEIGWALAPRAHGLGYATEAVQAALGWADRRWPGERTVCMIDPDNASSLRVAEKCGYREYARTSYLGSPTILFER
jgi:RimJ/RimL family protein N-acetyltransferase